MAIRIQHDVDLAEFNTFGIHARAQSYIRVTDDNDLPEALTVAQAHAGERGVFVLGSGSNLLLTRDYAGCVLHISTTGMRELDDDVIEAAAGESWHRLVMWSLERGLSGLENLSLIHGTVGAAPVQNIGAYGVELKDTFHSCDVISRASGRTARLDAADCAFGYRDSIFKTFLGRSWIIRRVRLKLSRTFTPRLDYGDVRSELLSKAIVTPTALQVSQAVQNIRTRKLPDPVLLGNAGSFFKNPVIPIEQFDSIRDTFPDAPHYPDRDGWIKVPAAWLIDQCGLKGLRRGPAGVHAQHALVLVNYGGATGAQLWDVAQEVIAAVDAKFSIILEPEPIVM